jgi:hypothetical protein
MVTHAFGFGDQREFDAGRGARTAVGRDVGHLFDLCGREVERLVLSVPSHTMINASWDAPAACGRERFVRGRAQACPRRHRQAPE